MDDGTGASIHTCECQVAPGGAWAKQSRGHAADATDCKNHICLTQLYTSCRFDGNVIITGTWDNATAPGPRELTVTGADPKLCPLAKALPPPPPPPARTIGN